VWFMLTRTSGLSRATLTQVECFTQPARPLGYTWKTEPEQQPAGNFEKPIGRLKGFSNGYLAMGAAAGF